MDKKEIHIDISLIPDYVRDRLAKATLEMGKEAFQQPGMEEKYQAWLADRKGRKDSKQSMLDL